MHRSLIIFLRKAKWSPCFAARTGRSQGGPGIGLALVKTIVRLHDGEVMADSAGPGHGSRFTVSLPLAARQ
jgi:signal transduction histidine kinase